MKLKAGFSLIEILVALAIVSLLAVVSIPRFRSAGPSAIKKISLDLNKLMLDAKKMALETNQIIKINLNARSNPKKIAIIDSAGKTQKIVEWPNVIEIADFFFDKKRGQGTDEMWYYINSDGIAQEVIFNVVDTRERENDPQSGNYGLVLNPFTSQFKLYDTFQSP